MLYSIIENFRDFLDDSEPDQAKVNVFGACLVTLAIGPLLVLYAIGII